ncbi:branched-chain amino acid transaminase [SAR202 cluster bacterium AD-804-J14_MRT_500m]|nr:branched-chain amino acid transaminase [SAR202 cluster bacterium AD-804-J14_MRT_500m]
MSARQYAFFKGEYVPLEDARVSISTHALHYGTGTFEGVRGNWNPDKATTFIFRLREHYERLLTGCKLLMLNIPYSVDDLCNITVELVERCGYTSDIYIRPLAYKSAELVANLKLHELESDFCLIVTPFGNYLGTDTLRCCTSGWRRPDDQTIPPRFKLTGTYINSVLVKTEAVLAGFDEAIVLNREGYVAEGSGENVFVVMNNKLHTPSLDDGALPGITRNTIIELAREELGLEVIEGHISRTELYLAQEAFLTGTAAHVTPMVELDSRAIADGQVGPISERLRDLYFSVATGNHPKYMHWCTPAIPRMAPT